MVLYFATAGGIVEEYPLSETHDLKTNSISVDDGAIRIDHAAHHSDETHLLLKGSLGGSEKYIDIQNQAGETLAQIDNTGRFLGNITAPELSVLNTTVDALTDLLATEIDDLFEAEQNISDLQTTVAENSVQVSLIQSHEDDLTGATHLPSSDQIVKRDSGGNANFEAVQAEIIAVGQTVSMYGDAACFFIPQEVVNGETVNKADHLYRFGRNAHFEHGELGDLTETGNGLEMKTPGSNGDNRILIQVNRDTPTIDIEYHKLSDPVIRFTTGVNDTVVEMDELGYHQQIGSTSDQIQPNAIHNLPLLDGCNMFELLLLGNMQTSDNTHLHITKNETDPMYLTFCDFEIASYNAVEDVYISRVIRRHNNNVITYKLHIKSTGTLPTNSIIYLMVRQIKHLS